MNIDTAPLRNLPPPFDAVSKSVDDFIAAEKAFEDLYSTCYDASADCHVLNCYIDGTADDEMLRRVSEIAEMECLLVEEDHLVSFEEAKELLEDYRRRQTEWEPLLAKAEETKAASQRTMRRAVGSALLFAKRNLRASRELPSTAGILVSGECRVAKRDVENAYARIRGFAREWLVQRQTLKECLTACAPLIAQVKELIDGTQADAE